MTITPLPNPPPEKLIFGFIKPRIDFGSLFIVIAGSYALYAAWSVDRDRIQNLINEVQTLQGQQQSVITQETSVLNSQQSLQYRLDTEKDVITQLSTALAKVGDEANTTASKVDGDERVYEQHFSDIDKNLAVLNSDSNLQLRKPRGMP